jgi:uncharacterized protein
MNAKIFFESTIGLFAVVDFLVVMRLYALLGAVRRPAIWRTLLILWAIGAIGFCLLIILANPAVSGSHDPFPQWLVSAELIWHFLVLPCLVGALLVDSIARVGVSVIGWFRRRRKPEPEPAPVSAMALSRRRFLTSAALLAVPVATGSMVGAAMWQLGKFRVRTFDLAIAGWPRELDDYSITVIADVHVGDLSTPQLLEGIVAVNNSLRSDMVLMPGDLINMSHADLPQAFDMVKRLESRDGVWLIEGNHDVIQGPDAFDFKVRRRGFNLLVDQAVTIRTRGSQFQLLGTRWCDTWFRTGSVAFTAGLREPGLFPLMMAHHPDSWDIAAPLGIPLMISGHTHGGQIMLTKSIGGGPLRFKYWTGRYDRPGSTLIVSNGVGNWFPLRINAPAEILRINMHPGEQA